MNDVLISQTNAAIIIQRFFRRYLEKQASKRKYKAIRYNNAETLESQNTNALTQQISCIENDEESNRVQALQYETKFVLKQLNNYYAKKASQQSKENHIHCLLSNMDSTIAALRNTSLTAFFPSGANKYMAAENFDTISVNAQKRHEELILKRKLNWWEKLN